MKRSKITPFYIQDSSGLLLSFLTPDDIYNFIDTRYRPVYHYLHSILFTFLVKTQGFTPTLSN